MKKILFATLIFIFTISSNTFAHTHLGSSTPEDGQVVTEELDEITLLFEGKIEQTSKMKLNNSQGQDLPFENISIEDGKMVGTLQSPLENGDYLVNWNIIGADGHPIKGEISFSVAVDSEKHAETSNSETEQPVKEETSPGETDEQNTAQETPEPEPNKSPSYLVPLIIIVLILVVAGTFLGIRRRNKS